MLNNHVKGLKMPKNHFQQNKPKIIWLVFFIITLLLMTGMYTALRFGAVSFSHKELLTVLYHPFRDSKTQDVIIDIRLPRIIAALFVGAAMTQAGSLIQGITRNAIADPGILGINSGAGLALVISYALFKNIQYTQILLICILGSAISAIIVFLLSYQKNKGYNQLRLILSGTMVSTLFTAIGQAITLYCNLETRIIGWQAGGLAQTNWTMIQIIVPIIILGLILSQLFAHQVTILSINETLAKSLGQHTLFTTLSLMTIVLIISSGAVALVGSIAFIGIIIPHFIKLFIPKDYRIILPLSAYAGATFLLWVDTISRVINPPSETPIGALISIVGLPCFLWLIRKGKYL